MSSIEFKHVVQKKANRGKQKERELMRMRKSTKQRAEKGSMRENGGV